MTALRVAFVLQEVLGWSTFRENLRARVESDPSLEATWIPVTYRDEGRWPENVPWLRDHQRGAARAADSIARGLRGRRFDAVLFNATWLAVLGLPWTGGARTAITLDVTPIQYDDLATHFAGQRGVGLAAGNWIKHRLTVAAVQRASALFPWSAWTARSLAEEYGARPDAVHVVPIGVDIDSWRAPDRTAHDRRALRVLFVGNDFVRKGGDLLLEWHRERGRGRCELDLVTGDPALNADGLTGVRVHRGLVANSPQLKRLFQLADVFCLPSRGEPFGIAAVEASASGLPIVVGDVGGLREIVEHGVTGYAVSPGDPRELGAALELLLDSPRLRASMGTAARLRAEHHFSSATNFGRLLARLKGDPANPAPGQAPVFDGDQARQLQV